MSADVPHLAHFVAVADVGNISQAARKLGLSQPALSRQIQLLEDAVGVDLFVRESKGVTLTGEGQEFLAAVRPALSQIEEALTRLRAHTDAPVGTIRFGCLTEIGQSHFMDKVLAFQDSYPEVLFEILYLKEHEILSALRGGDLDCGVITSTEPGESLVTYHLFEERVVVVARRSFEGQVETLEEVRGHRWVSYRSGDPLLAAWVSSHFGAVKAPSVVTTVNSHRSMTDALQALDACAVMPWESVKTLVEAGVLRVVSSLEHTGALYWVRGDKKRTSRALTVFQSHVLGHRERAGTRS